MRFVRGFTLVELMVVMAVIAILAGIAIPAITMVRGNAQRIACLSNLRQVGMAMIAYSSEHDGFLPAEGNKGIDDPESSPAWFYRLPPYLDDTDVRGVSVFQCAAFGWAGGDVFDHASPKSLKFNAWIDNGGRPQHHVVGRLSDEAEIVGFFDAVGGETGNGQLGNGTPNAVDADRHNGRVNVLALDGHTLSTARGGPETDWEDELKWLSDRW